MINLVTNHDIEMSATYSIFSYHTNLFYVNNELLEIFDKIEDSTRGEFTKCEIPISVVDLLAKDSGVAALTTVKIFVVNTVNDPTYRKLDKRVKLEEEGFIC